MYPSLACAQLIGKAWLSFCSNCPPPTKKRERKKNFKTMNLVKKKKSFVLQKHTYDVCRLELQPFFDLMLK